MDSRTIRNGRAIRRRRECVACGHRFTTYEVVEEEPIGVEKRSGAIEAFDRGKLLESVRIACAKRPVSHGEIDALVDGIEERLNQSDRREVTSREIGEMVMARLRELDQVAYVRFASVYRNFQDTAEFTEEVHELSRRQRYAARGQVDLFEAQPEEAATSSGVPAEGGGGEDGAGGSDGGERAAEDDDAENPEGGQ